MRKDLILCVMIFLLLMGVLFYAEFGMTTPTASASTDTRSATIESNKAKPAAENEIRGILERYYEIARTNDRAALKNYSREIIAPEYRYSSELGVKDKTETLRFVDSLNVKFLETEFKDFEIQVQGDAAIVKYLDVSKIRTKGDSDVRHNLTRFTNVWVRRDGRWQIVAEHSSSLAPPKLLPRHALADNVAKK